MRIRKKVCKNCGASFLAVGEGNCYNCVEVKKKEKRLSNTYIYRGQKEPNKRRCV